MADKSTTLSFAGRVAVVTGAARGIGRANAMLLAERGATVIVNNRARRENGAVVAEPASEVAAEIVAAGGKAVADHGDIGTPDGAAGLVANAVDRFGRIDIVVNNAGIHRNAEIDEITLAEFEEMLRVNLLGSFMVTQAAWPHMVRQGHGRVVLTSSVTGYFGAPNAPHYSATKAAIHGLMRALAPTGAASGIHVNAISPAAFTRMMSNSVGPDFLKKVEVALRPEQVSPLVAWLCHEDCTINGEAFLVGGGKVARFLMAMPEGYFDPAISIESLRDNEGAVMSLEDFTLPRVGTDVVKPIFARYGV